MKQGKKTAAVLAAAMCVGLTAGATEGAVSLDPVMVLGVRDVTTADGYASTVATVGTLGEWSVMETPFSQTNITQKTMATFNDPSQPSVAPLVQAPSVRSSSSTMYNDFSIRGQSANSYQFRVNGVPGIFTQMNLGTSFVDRVEIISGPTMAVNGTASHESPGGSINLLSKQAGDKDQTAVTLRSAGKSTVGLNLDASARLGEQRDWGVRVNAEYTNGTTGIKDERRDNKDVYLNIDHHDDTSRTNLLLGYRDVTTEKPQRYFNFESAAIDRMMEAPDHHQNYSFDGQHLSMKTTAAILNHQQRLNDHILAFVNAGMATNDGYSYVMTQSSRIDILNAAGDFERNLWNQPFKLKNKYLQIGLRGDIQTGEVKHNWNIAWDKDWLQEFWGITKKTRPIVTKDGKPDLAQEVIRGNIFTRQYTLTGMPEAQTPYAPSRRSQFTGITASDTMTWGDFQLLVGVQRATTNVLSVGDGSRVKSSATSPMYGLLYKANDNVSIYASHAESFGKGTLVGRGYINNGEILPPEKMIQNEFGVKYWKDGVLASLAYFDMERDANIEVPGKEPRTSYLRQNGRSDFRGIEASVSGVQVGKFSLTGGLMYLDSKYAKSKTGNLDGKPVSGVAKWSGIVTAEYSPNEQLDIIGRMVYTGEAKIYAKNTTQLTLPSSAVFDLGVRYRFGDAQAPVLNAMVYNVADKNYWLPRPGYNYGILSNPRTYSLSLTWSF